MLLMKSIPAKEAKNRFGALLDAAQREPVMIRKNGRDVAVLMSIQDYRRFEELEEERWGNK